MKYYKDLSGEIYAFEDNVTQNIINNVAKKHNTTLTQISEIEYKSFKLFGTFDKTEEEIKQKEEEIKLNQAKQNKINYLKQKFLETLKKGYVTSVSENRFYSEEQDIAKLKNAYDLAIAANIITMKVKTLDGRTDLSVDDVKRALLELGEYYQSQLQKLWDLEDQVENATTIKEVETIKWED